MASGGILVAVKVTAPQAKLLQAMAERAGEISWNWQNCRPDVERMARDLIENRLVTDDRDRRMLRLTEQGRAAVSQIEHANRRARIIEA